MNKAFIKLELIILVDAVFILLCIIGVYQISEKAKLPFEIKPAGSTLYIKAEPTSFFHKFNNFQLVLVDGIPVKTLEEVELLTDRKNIGDEVQINLKKSASNQNFNVKLTRFYSNSYLLSISFTSFLFFLTAVFVILRKPNEIAAIIFHWASIGIACMIDLTWANNNKSIIIPYYISRIPFHFFYLLVPLFFLHFTFIFPNKEKKFSKLVLFPGYFIGLLLGTISFISYSSFIVNNTSENLKAYILAFNISRIFLVVLVVFSIVNFLFSYFTEKEVSSRKKLKWVLYGFLIGPLGFSVFWSLPILILNKPLVPEEFILLLMCTVPITFTIAILKYHILDIDYLINRSIVYSIAVSIMIVLYISIISLIISNFTLINQKTISVATAVLIALIFNPLKIIIQNYVNKIFFRVQYDIKEELSSFLSEIKQFNDTDELSEFLINKITKLMPVEKIGYCLYDKEEKQFSLTKNKNFDLISGKKTFLKDEILENEFLTIAAEKNCVEPEANVSKILINIPIELKISLILPIVSEEKELHAVILLGKKKSGIKFSIEDIEILKSISNEAAATIKRIILQKQLLMEKLEAEKLQELNRQKSMYVSVVSHDLKTPLTSIKLFVNKILEKENELSDLSKRNLKIIDGEADRLTRLINNVLDYVKIENGIKSYSFREIHLNEIVKKVIDLMKYTLTMNEFKLWTDFTESDDLVYADEDALIEAFQNVISNSVKFSTNKKELIIKTFCKNNYVCVSIADKGIGIKKSDIEKIYEPFYQSSSKRLSADGAGLGLTIVKHIIEAHNGRIMINSEENIGTEFIFYLTQMRLNEV